nr:MAG TPA: hypothetical protein [Caudoviricetes sp.]
MPFIAFFQGGVVVPSDLNPPRFTGCASPTLNVTTV